MRDNVIKQTFIVAGLLCLVCSLIVSAAAVSLRPIQQKNATLDKHRKILQSAGLYDPAKDVEAQFAAIDAKVVDLETGEYVEDIDPKTYDQKDAAGDPDMSVSIEGQALRGISRRAKYAVVYIYNEGEADGGVILPVHGKGLWSTLYGYIAIKNDHETVEGLNFYQHAETPGLGGEVDNPNWKSQWHGKKLYNEEGELALTVIKGKVDTSRSDAVHKIDGLSGATITTRGIDNLIEYWLGENGFGPYLEKLKDEDMNHG